MKIIIANCLKCHMHTELDDDGLCNKCNDDPSQEFTRTIITEHIRPPVPSKDYDWRAYYEGTEEDNECGYGDTEAKAIQNLQDNYKMGENHVEGVKSSDKQTIRLCYMDLPKFNELFWQPDPWKRVAAYQYGITYEQVTMDHRRAMKSMYFGYIYGNNNPMKLGDVKL